MRYVPIPHCLLEQYRKNRVTQFQLQNHAIAVQPLDTKIRHDAYINVPYPFILGGTLAGKVVAVGDKVQNLKVGDRVVSDTPIYKKRDVRYGGWQKFVVGREGFSAKVMLLSCFSIKGGRANSCELDWRCAF